MFFLIMLFIFKTCHFTLLLNAPTEKSVDMEVYFNLLGQLLITFCQKFAFISEAR